MRNRITSIIILVSIVLLSVAMFRGISIGNLEILSISQLKEKNNKLHERIDKASRLTSIDYPKNIETLKETFEDYMIQKEKYEDLAGVSGENIEDIYETKQYDISYLWRVLGKYAQNRNLTLGIDVQTASRLDSSYNFNFTVSGQYVNIIQFITDIENNSDLYFRIHNFKMSGSGTNITSTFTVKNINVDSSTIKTTQTSSENLFTQAD